MRPVASCHIEDEVQLNVIQFLFQETARKLELIAGRAVKEWMKPSDRVTLRSP